MESSATWPGRLLQVGAAVFIVALAYSTVLAPPTLLLHAFQALVYLPIIPLARRNRPWLFGAAFMLAAAWNTANLFVTGFIRAGIETLAGIPVAPANPGYVPVVIGACGHFLMIIGLLVAFLRGRPGARSWGGFAAGAVLGILAMAAITPLRMRLHRRPLPLDVPNRVAMESAIKYSGGLTGPARSGSRISTARPLMPGISGAVTITIKGPSVVRTGTLAYTFTKRLEPDRRLDSRS